jgi:hypothetical protein
VTSRYSHPPGAPFALIISCDQIDCTVSIDDKAIEAGGGLKELGWEVLPTNGKLHHYCPDHRRTLQSKE